jgi:hypothetical protein
MPMRSALIASLMLVLAAANAATEDSPQGTPQDQAPGWTEFQSPERQDQAPGWTEFQSPERGFAIAFPGAPKMTSTPVEGQNPLTQYEFELGLGDDTVYNVVVFEYPAGKAPNPPDLDYYAKLVAAYAKGSDSRLRKKGPATVAGHQGYEAMADDNKGKLNHLIDIVPGGDRIYMLVSAGPKGHAASDDAEHFRDSFRLVGDQPVSATPPPSTP